MASEPSAPVHTGSGTEGAPGSPPAYANVQAYLCPKAKCQEPLDIRWKYCPMCATRLPYVCGNCFTPIKKSFRFCFECGAQNHRFVVVDPQIFSHLDVVSNRTGLPLELDDAEDLYLTESSFTCMAWVKWNGEGEDVAIFGSMDPIGANVILHLNIRQQKYYLGFGWNDVSATVSARPGQWDHVAYVYSMDASKQIIYVNGKKSGERTATPFKGTAKVMVGDGTVGQEFGGKLKGIRIFSYALPEQEVNQFMNQDRAIEGPPVEIRQIFHHPSAVTKNNGLPIELGPAGSTGMDITNNSFSLMCWLKWNGHGGDVSVFGSSDPIQPNVVLHCNIRGNRYYLGFGWNDLHSPTHARQNEWDHVTYVYDADDSKQRIYVNGETAGERTASAFQGTGNLFVGHGSCGEAFQGEMKGIRIFQNVLTLNQIQAYRNEDQ